MLNCSDQSLAGGHKISRFGVRAFSKPPRRRSEPTPTFEHLERLVSKPFATTMASQVALKKQQGQRNT
jgi:hypothetical protein